MIKLLEDLLIKATTTPNVPGSLVAGLRKAVDAARCGSVKGKTFAFTGVLPTLSRDEACVRIEEAGGVIVSAVSAKLDYLVAGDVAGSKLLKALELDVPVIGEKQLQAMLPGVIARLKGMITPDLLPPPFDSQEEAQRAAGIWPQEAEPATVRVAYCPPYWVCVKAHETTVGNTVPVGHVVTLEVGESLQQPDCWLPCDKEGWVSCRLSVPVGPVTEWRGHPGLSDWRPVRTPKPSAIDEMAEQMRRWAAPTREDLEIQAKVHEDTRSHLPESVMSEKEIAAYRKRGESKLTNPKDALTREDFDKAIDGLSEAMGVPKRRLLGQAQEATPALAVQEGGSHYKSMKIQPVEYIHANGLGYFEGNVVKYVSRWRAKGGLQDLKKARHYLDLLIELEGDTK